MYDETELRTASVNSNSKSNLLSHYLESLLKVSSATATTIKPEDQARAALGELIKVLKADRAFLFRVDESGTNFTMQAGLSSSNEDLAEIVGFSSTVIKLACKDRRALVVHGTEEGLLIGSESAVMDELRSIMATPMIVQDKLIGAVLPDSKATNGMFTDEDAQFLKAIVNQMAISVQLSWATQNETERIGLEKDIAVAAAVQSFFSQKSVILRINIFKAQAFTRPLGICLETGGGMSLLTMTWLFCLVKYQVKELLRRW